MEARRRVAFRHAVVNTLERHMFYTPSFKIYGGVAGLYDYGPPGTALKSNLLSFWHRHFVVEENMLEVDCSCVTPEVVLKASGHHDKFTDLMVKDEKTGTCYRADHLLRDYCKEKLEKDVSLSAEKTAELKHVLAVLDDFSAQELGAMIKGYGITAPDTKNPLSDPYPFNLMFQTSIGPSGVSPGYMRPETAQGIFVNFKDLFYYNGNKLPFAVAQKGQAFRNEMEARRRVAFRHAVVNTLERHMFYTPSFKIYGGVAGLYDYGPPGTALKSNLLSFWHRHFVVEENMLEVDCACVTPEVVLKASGHHDKFTDLMVKDEKTGACYRADHLLRDYCKEKLEKDVSLSAEKTAELKHVLAVLDDFSAQELGAMIKGYGITAPDTKNPLSDPYPFNLMFQTSIGPSGVSPGYMRPETAQGIFVNFKDLFYYNGNKLPFAVAQKGQAFRNEISPRQGLLRVREFTLAEIEHFVDPEDKSHPKFSEVSNLEFLMFTREDQVSGLEARKISIGEAVSQGFVNNETLGYFLGRVYLFLTKLGIAKGRLRFRQHLANEMAHYAADCWDAEIECSHGWIECVGVADRSAFDLRAHSEKSGVPLVAHQKYAQPRVVEKLVIVPVKKELGLAFKGSQKMVVEALEAMGEKEAMEMKSALRAKGEADFRVCSLDKVVTIKNSMVSISKVKKKEHERVFTPSVIEPSFGIGRIIYCLFEHSFYTRPSKDGDEQLKVFRFHPLVAPIKCRVFSLVQNQMYEEVAESIAKSLTASGISCQIDKTGNSIGKKYAKTDELGVPLAITVDSPTSVTVRERDSKQQIRVNVEEVASLVRSVTDGVCTWADILQKHNRSVFRFSDRLFSFIYFLFLISLLLFLLSKVFGRR